MDTKGFKKEYFQNFHETRMVLMTGARLQNEILWDELVPIKFYVI
jgi:hypothetical protein